MGFSTQKSVLVGTAVLVGLGLLQVLGLLMSRAGEVPSETSSNAGQKLVVHEWGTFTNFAGSDGVQLEFRPLVRSDLPRFVNDGSFSLFGKRWTYARQRMETPVTYFYTDAPREVEVRVDFPQGMLTEWYPVVKEFGPRNRQSQPIIGKSPLLRDSFLDWGKVRLIPQEALADIKVRGNDGKPEPAGFPEVKQDDHYGYARETDSAIVEKIDQLGGSHFEKFLFYQGLGNFNLPVKFVALGKDQFEVTNAGDRPIGTMFLVEIQGKQLRYTRFNRCDSKKFKRLTLTSKPSTVVELSEDMVQALVSAGLYEKEARAMVKTWHSSWFGESGTRLFYLAPQDWTDKVLPLKITPAPAEIVRVMVGRMEVLTPEASRQILASVQNIAGHASSVPLQLPPELTSLGRFAEPALRYLLAQTKDTVVRDRLKQTLEKVSTAE